MTSVISMPIRSRRVPSPREFAHSIEGSPNQMLMPSSLSRALQPGRSGSLRQPGAQASSAMIGWMASSNAEASDRSESVTATVIAPIHHTPGLRRTAHLDVELEGVRATAHLPLVLGDRAGVGAVRVAAPGGGSFAVALVGPVGPGPRRLGVRHDGGREHLGARDGQRDLGLVPSTSSSGTADGCVSARRSSPTTRATAAPAGRADRSRGGRRRARHRAGAAVRAGRRCPALRADRARGRTGRLAFSRITHDGVPPGCMRSF